MLLDAQWLPVNLTVNSGPSRLIFLWDLALLLSGCSSAVHVSPCVSLVPTLGHRRAPPQLSRVNFPPHSLILFSSLVPISVTCLLIVDF